MPIIHSRLCHVGLLVGLAATCWNGGSPYALPSNSGGSLLLSTASNQQPPIVPPPASESLDEMLRIVELGQVDAVLDRTARKLGTSLDPGFAIGWHDADLAEAIKHLRQIRLEYWRQQRLACEQKIIDRALCQPAGFERTLDFIDNSADFRKEILQTMDKVQTFSRGISFESGGRRGLEKSDISGERS